MKQKKDVMIVDDDSVVHFLSEKALSTFHWINKKYNAFNGKEAIQVLEDYCKGVLTLPDLILLDLHMPVMNGFEFIEAFKKMDCLQNNRIVIAVFTSSDCPKERAKLNSFGISNVIAKPVSIEKLDLLLRKEFQETRL